MIIEKDVGQLTVGSYVVDIVAQSGNYSIKKPGFIRDFAAIEFLIEQGVSRVQVDTSKRYLQESSVQPVEGTSGEAPVSVAAISLKSKPKKSKRKPSKDFSEQLEDAQSLYLEAKTLQNNILDDIKSGKSIDVSPVKAFTNESIASIFENPDALACVINMRSKDEYLLEHSVAVSVLMTIFAAYFKYDKALISELAIGAFLHDVGKVKVESEILNKPGKLTPEEFERIKLHAVYSKEIVDATEGISDLTRTIVANHHEKLTGSGYPKGLIAKELTQYDRMITLCDIYDALTANRIYKAGIAQVRAFSILRELGQKGELDLSLVDQFIRCLGVYPVGTLVQLSSNRLAIVAGRNNHIPTKPIVKTFYSLQNNAFTTTKKIDLSKSESERIEKGVRADDFDLDMNKITEFLMLQA